MYLFYTAQDEFTGRVEGIYQDHEVSESDKAKGIHYTGELPAHPTVSEHEEALLHVNLADSTLWYEVVEKTTGDNVAELRQRLNDAEGRLKNADERYRALKLQAVNLDQLKTAKVAQLKYLSEAEMAQGFTSLSLGYVFGFDKGDEANMTKQALAFVTDVNKVDCSWKTLSNGVVTLSRDQFMGLIPEAEEHTRQKVGRQWQLAAQVMAASTKEEVDAIVW